VTYLIAEMMACLMVAALLGLGMGYILWGLVANRRREEIKSLNETVTARAVESEQLTKKVEQLTAAQAEAAKQAAASTSEKEAEIAGLSTRTVELEQKKNTEVAGLTRRIADLEGQLSQLRANLQTKESEIAGHLQMHTEKDRQLTLLKSKTPELEAAQTAALAEKDKQLQTLRNKIGELQAAHDQVSSEKNERLVALRNRIDDLERAHADKDAHLANLNAKLAEFQPAEAAGAASVVQPSLSSAAGAGGLAGYMLRSPQSPNDAESILSSLFEPLNQPDVARVAAQMRTGSQVGDWLEAERRLRLERLDSVQKNWSELKKGGD
jgi:uncharacterized coiled-coil protein SlyX